VGFKPELNDQLACKSSPEMTYNMSSPTLNLYTATTVAKCISSVVLHVENSKSDITCVTSMHLCGLRADR